MITGDNKRTAEAICRNIGVFGERERTDGLSYEGEELMKMTKVRCQVARAEPFASSIARGRRGRLSPTCHECRSALPLLFERDRCGRADSVALRCGSALL